MEFEAKMNRMLMVALIGLGAQACGDTQAMLVDLRGGGDAEARASQDLAADAAAASNALALRLLPELASTKCKCGPNPLFAPASISVSLSMLSAGAGGTTEQEVTALLGYAGQRSDLTRSYGELSQSLADLPAGGTELVMANKAWAQTGFAVLPEFQGTLQSQFRARLEQVDFVTKTEESRQMINAWVKDKTRGTIQDIIAPGAVTEATQLVLTNALYVNAAWSQPFDSALTSEESFYAPSGVIQVPMMRQGGRFPHARSERFDYVEMPYADLRFALGLVVPRIDTRDPWLEPGFANEMVELIASAERRLVSVELPRFSARASADLAKTLTDLGMSSAFGAEADFSNITRERTLAISDVAHKAFIDVTERGTEAGASTATIVYETAMTEESRTVRADRPFLYVLRDRENGAYVMLGALREPRVPVN